MIGLGFFIPAPTLLVLQAVSTGTIFEELYHFNAEFAFRSLMCRMRVFQYYIPVFFWCWKQVKVHQESGNKQPLIIGMQAVQGCGKTTLVEQLQNLFTHVGLKAASVSIDDFYLPYQGQQQLIKVCLSFVHPEQL